MSPISEKPTSIKADSVSEEFQKQEVKHLDRVNVANNPNAKLANPLEGIPHDQLIADAAAFAKSHGLGHLTEVFQKGALVAQDPSAFESLPLLDDEDRNVLRREVTHKWRQPAQLYYLVILCSMAAAVQGVSPHRALLVSGYSSKFLRY